MSRWLYQLSYRSSGASFGQNTLFRSIHLHGPDRANTDAARAYCTLFLVECKKARFDVDGQRGGRAQSRAHAALHTLVLIMPDPLRHGRNQYALLPQVADPLSQASREPDSSRVKKPSCRGVIWAVLILKSRSNSRVRLQTNGAPEMVGGNVRCTLVR